jgi:Zn-finger nucleic acid-binding protein
MREDTCPKCGGTALTTGKAVAHSFPHGGGTATFFEPDGLRSRWFRLPPSVETAIVGGFQVCLKCGLVWSHVSPDELQTIIEKQGTDEAKSRLPQ